MKEQRKRQEKRLTLKNIFERFMNILKLEFDEDDKGNGNDELDEGDKGSDRCKKISYIIMASILLGLFALTILTVVIYVMEFCFE